MTKRQQIGERIKTMRMARGMSQLDLANKLSCGQSTVAMWETGQRQPDLDMIDFLADIFNIAPYSIVYSEKEVKDMIDYTLSLTVQEDILLQAFRAADERAKEDALNTLLQHPQDKREKLA